MIKRSIIIATSCLCSWQMSTAQKSGIMPLTGIRYFDEGVWAKSIAFKIGGKQLYGNRVPLDQDIELSIEQPTGFTADKKKLVFAGAEYTLVSNKGKVLLSDSNLLSSYAKGGFTAQKLKMLSLKFRIAEGLVQPNSECTIMMRFYDLKSKKQLRLEYPVSISYPREVIWLTNAVKTLKSPPGSIFMATDLTARSLTISIDTTINPKTDKAYLKLEISKIDGTDIIGMLQGKERFWVYDRNYKEIPVKEILLKKVNGGMEGGSVNCTLNIPYKRKSEKADGYFVRYRWDSGDKTQVIDIVVAK
ncbi:MAG: hypothetical protein IPL84_14645 [Chitinophagaceae bacterium]|nr:hypothetical protein [Chitinophagaceae bacterium]